MVALGLQIYDITSSTFAVGLLGVFALVPLVALGLYGGALVDAYDRRKVALASAAGLWLAVLGLVAQAVLGLDSVGLLYLLVAFQSAGFAINNPARSAIIPRLVDPRLLPAANVLQTVAWNVASTAGPLLAAVLVAGVGYVAAYAVDAVLFTAALWALWRLPGLPPISESGAVRPPGSRRQNLGLGAVADGLRYLATRSNVAMTFVVDLIAMIAAMPRVLFPAVGVLFLGGGAATTGVLSAAFAAGAVLAGLFSGGLVRVVRQGLVVVVAIVVFGLAVAGFGGLLVGLGADQPAAVRWLPLIAAGVLLAVAGGADSISAVFRQTILQSATPDDLRGRLQGIFIVVVAGGPRLGDLVLGSAASWTSEGWAALGGGLLCALLVAAVSSAQRGFLAYDARYPTP